MWHRISVDVHANQSMVPRQRILHLWIGLASYLHARAMFWNQLGVFFKFRHLLNIGGKIKYHCYNYLFSSTPSDPKKKRVVALLQGVYHNTLFL